MNTYYSQMVNVLINNNFINQPMNKTYIEIGGSDGFII